MRNDALWMPDMSDGAYRNPVLFADYSDPDAIRVGDVYYLTASSFNYVPGLPILTSRDLVNWTLQGYALPNIPDSRYAVPRHAQGVWAPALRWHEGYFYIYYGMPDEGIFMVRARDALSDWEPPVPVLEGKGLIDPCPFWDEDGTACVVHGYAKSRIGFKSFLGMFPMSADGTCATGNDRLIYDGRATQPTIEGPKVYKREGWFYIFAPAGGVSDGWQTVLRARSLNGPFEERVVLKQGHTEVNGPHQGAWVETPQGESWFLHFQSRGVYGRIVHLQPMRWQENGWPMIGVRDDAGVQATPHEPAEDAVEAAELALATDCGVPALLHAKPTAPVCEPAYEKTSDAYESARLGLQWQFMGNWRQDFFSLTERAGWLRLFARKLPEGSDPVLWHCPQTLTQKLAGPECVATVKVDAASLHAGEQAGLALVGGQYAYVALRRASQGLRLVFAKSGGTGATREETLVANIAAPAEQLSLRVCLRQTGYDQAEARFHYGTDEACMTEVGEPFCPEKHTWVGARLALMCMPPGQDLPEKQRGCGHADFGAFRVCANVAVRPATRQP